MKMKEEEVQGNCSFLDNVSGVEHEKSYLPLSSLIII
jgi:hypothetical protein